MEVRENAAHSVRHETVCASEDVSIIELVDSNKVKNHVSDTHQGISTQQAGYTTEQWNNGQWEHMHSDTSQKKKPT